MDKDQLQKVIEDCTAKAADAQATAELLSAQADEMWAQSRLSIQRAEFLNRLRDHLNHFMNDTLPNPRFED